MKRVYRSNETLYDNKIAREYLLEGTETEARKAFYRLCGQAVDSDYLTDTVVLMTKFGDVIDKERFDHRAES